MVDLLSQVAYGWHIGWMLIFDVLATGYLIVTVVNRMRVTGVRIVWHRPWFVGRASWPAAFMLLMAVGLFYAFFASRILAANLLLGYLAGAICWCTAIRLSRAVLVTSDLLVTRLGKPDGYLYWRQVSDYFIVHMGRYSKAVFLFNNSDGTRSRLELKVPAEQVHHFSQLVNRFVDKRHLSQPAKAYG